MIYLTFNDAPGGILKSQVIDVVQLLREQSSQPIDLVNYVSVRQYKGARQWIKEREPGATVLPMTPKLKNWRKNRWQLKVSGPGLQGRTVIARGIFAANLALDLKAAGKVAKVVYDGRGAIAAEVEEYQVVPPPIDAEVPALERRAVLEADHHIAVTQKLVEYWEEQYGYQRGPETIIPCTLSAGFQLPAPDEVAGHRKIVRESLGWAEEAVVLVYSGSTAGWQSFELLEGWLQKQLQKPEMHVLFLSQEDERIAQLESAFPGRVARRWLSHDEVLPHLYAGDYGIMLREESVTNRVASPTKFAEYLIAGLEVLSSPHIGDYPDFIREHGCGQLISTDEEGGTFYSISVERKRELMQLGRTHFSKSSEQVLGLYRSLLQAIT